MGLLDRLLGRRRGFDALRAPWGERPSIHDHLREHAGADGTLPRDYTLPDAAEADAESDTELSWAAGALDGVMSHHAAPGDDAERAAKIAASVIELTRRPTDEELARLYELATEAPLLECADPLVKALLATRDLDADELHALGRYLATRAADRELVKLGATLLGLVAGPDDRDVLWTLGAHDELTLYAIVALQNRPDASERDLWTLAKRARGWGRVQAVERLADTEDPAIRAWMLRDGFRNDVMDEYLAYRCAVAGRLHEALAEDDIDDALVDGAAGILAALVRGGPAEDMRDYEHGAEVSERFLSRVSARDDDDLSLLAAVAELRAFVEVEPDPALTMRGWTTERRARIREQADAILARPGWMVRIEQALDAADERERGRGEELARMLGVDTWQRQRARLERDPLDQTAWLELMRQCDDERLEVALGLAERLPLDDIATGPADLLGLGPEHRPHQCLDAILQDLDRFAGRGWPLIRVGLASPVVRNRNMALRALAAWPRDAWPDDAARVLEETRDREPVDDVRALAEDVLAGRPLD